MKRIPRVFIGSSKESKEIANLVMKELCDTGEYDCVIWDENFFELNEGTYKSLVKNSIGFDFAIFVGGKDDLTKRTGITRAKAKNKVRDNVYFEFGLYAGILSPERTFFLMDRSCNIASDLLGTTISPYSSEEDVRKECKKIIRKMKIEETVSRIQLMPSTSLAYGYYRNFLKPLVENLSENPVFKADGKIFSSISKIRIEVVLPQNVSTDWSTWASYFYSTQKLIPGIIDGRLRTVGVRVEINKLESEGELCIFDVPQTLLSSFDAVDMAIEKNYIGQLESAVRAKQHEVTNFVRTLRALAKENIYLQEYLEIKEYDLNCTPVVDTELLFS